MWLSLVERAVRDCEVGGSNPLTPTNLVVFAVMNVAAKLFVKIIHLTDISPRKRAFFYVQSTRYRHKND